MGVNKLIAARGLIDLTAQLPWKNHIQVSVLLSIKSREVLI